MQCDGLNKIELSERGIGTKYILSALQNAGGDEMLQLRAEFWISNASARQTGKP